MDPLLTSILLSETTDFTLDEIYIQKKLHFSKLILKYKNNIKKTWQIIKEAIGKEKCNQHRFPTKIVVDKESITNIHSIAENFNKFFTEIGPNLANKINPSRKHFHEYLKEFQAYQPDMLFP